LKQIFKDATLFFSRELSDEYPATNIATVIPAMDTIDEVLAINAIFSKYSVAIHAALSVGKKTLNCYYEKTNFSKIYQIAMGISSLLSQFYNCLLFSPFSPSSPSQAQLFQECKVGG